MPNIVPSKNGQHRSGPIVPVPRPPNDPRLRMLHNAIMGAIRNDKNVFWGRNGGGGLNGLDGGHNGDRWKQLDDDLGYPTDINDEILFRLYARGGIAARVVNLWPDESWAYHPEIYQTEKPKDTPWERAWKSKVVPQMPWHFLHRIDRMSGIGSYGVLLLGLPGADLAEPVAGIDPDTGEWSETPPGEIDLKYVRAYGAPLVRVKSSDKNFASPRYGQPVSYEIQFAFPGGGAGVDPRNLVWSEVHWTRVVHVADNQESSLLYGIPRCQPVLNYLYDIRKVAGSAGEMFFKGGFPGYAFEAYPDQAGGDSDTNTEDVEAEIWRYTRGLQRYLTSIGGKWNSLAVQVADPKGHIEVYLQLLCATIGVPVRIFTGAESGHLASSQDATNWKERVKGRQSNYLEPMVVRPFVDRLMGVGVLPRVKNYIVDWKDLRALSSKDKADVALKQIQACFQFMTGNLNQILPEPMFWTQIMGFTEDQAKAIGQFIEENGRPELLMPEPPAAGSNPGGRSQGGVRTGNPARAQPGRPAGGTAGQPKPATTPSGRRRGAHSL